MCTVSYIPSGDGFIVTSNRDENISRESAYLPVIESFGNNQFAYPKDPKGGGTWIVSKNASEVAVLLNGAFENHTKLQSYRKSRGLILMEVIRSNSPEKAFEEINLSEIENFTLLLFKKDSVLECRWDGIRKYKKSKNASLPHIWSSATLYPNAIKEQRETWFLNWLKVELNIDQSKAISFHRNTGSKDKENGLLIKRNNNISTVSITSVYINSTNSKLWYEDLISSFTKKINLQTYPDQKEPLIERLKLYLRIIAIKTFNWEYWPMHVVYLPMYIYWLYLSTRAKSFFFFSTSNPTRKNAGFAMEKKSDCYKHLAKHFYPKTILCQPGYTKDKLKAKLTDVEIDFPLIAKPDMGERGIGVKLINTLTELAEYSKMSKSDFLIQSFIDYPQEAGFFYHRIPGQENGQITGIVGKHFLTIAGDGKSTLEKLIKKSHRHLLQLKVLRKIYGKQLEQILQDGEEKLLVPYGNHCRGAKFIDQSFMINEKITSVIDHLCKEVPEFYFGRLDIKFSSWEELERGEKFSVIELNGAASEPTHIYDSKHSIFFAWKEIKRHWDILFHISKLNAENNSIPKMNTLEGLKMLREHHLHVKSLCNV